MVSSEGILEQASHWVEFRNQVKGIKPRINSNWVDINGVPDQEGVTEVVHWKDVLSGMSPDLEAFKLRDPDHFSVGGLHQNVEAWDNVLEGHPLAERIGGWIRDKVDSEPGIPQICRHENGFQTMSRAGSSRISYRGRLLTVFLQGRLEYGGRLVWMTPLIWCFL